MRLSTLWAVVRGTRWFGAAPRTDEERLEAVLGMYRRYRSAFEHVPEVAPAALLAELDGPTPPVLIDVRSPAERAISTIPGALSVEVYEAEAPDGPVVTFCTIGARSGDYAARLLTEGREVRNLSGSLLAWTHAGGPLVDDAGPTVRLHVYGPRWDLAASGIEAVW